MKTDSALYKAAFKNSGEAMALIDRNGNLIDANQACLNLLKLNKKSLSSFNLLEFFKIPDRQKRSLLNGNEITIEHTYEPDLSKTKKTHPANKGEKDINIKFKPVNIEKKSFSAYIAVLDEIKTVKTPRDQQAASTPGYKPIFDNNHAVMLLIDPENGDIADANPAASAYYGWSVEELKKKKINEINPLTKKQIAEELHKARTYKRNYFKFKHKRADGSIRDVEIYSGPIQLKNKTLLLTIIFDITDRVIAKKALQNSEEHFRLLVENIPAAIFVQTNECFAYVNQPAVRLFGAKNAKDLLGKKIIDRIHPSCRELIFERMKQTNEIKNINPELEEIYLKLDSTPINVEVSAVPFSYQGNDGALVFVRDITKRKKAEKNLKKSTDRLQSIFHTSPVGIGVYEDSILKEVNEQLCQVTGYTRKELIGQNINKLFLDRKEYNNVRGKIFKNNPSSAPITAEAHWKKKDGSIINVILAHTQIVPDINSSATFTVLDITERKQHEEQIHLLSQIADIAPVTIFIHDITGKILYANENTFKTLGYTKEEFRDITLHDLIGPKGSNHAPSRRQKIVEEGEASFEIDIRRKDGTIFPMRVNARTIKWEEKDVTLSVSTDLSEQKLTEEYVSRTHKLESLGVLAGGIAHDFNNLLGVLFGYLNLAIMTSSENEVIKYLEKAVNGFNRAKNLTQQLLTFSKGGAPDRKTSSVASLLKESTGFALSGSNIEIQYDIPDNLWLCGFDKNQMEQLIDNIVINAKQAMPSGGTLKVSAFNTKLKVDEYPSLTDGKYVKISITDSGIGMPKNILPQIFDPFFTTKQEGNGLGLATVYSIIKKHKGDIFVESSPGKGSTFNIFIPAAAKQHHIIKKPQEKEHKGNGHVLILDDEPGIRHVASQMLKKMGYNTATASNGNEALEIFNKAVEDNKPFNIAFLDLTIPGEKGGEKIVQEFNKINQELIAFAMSGYSDDPVMSNPSKYGFNDKLSKPFMKSDLAQLLNRHYPQGEQNKK